MHFENSNQANPAAGFMHLLGGYINPYIFLNKNNNLNFRYDAGYYGYLRAESYAANMFYKMFKEGKVLDPETGMRYRTKLLQPGSTKDGV